MTSHKATVSGLSGRYAVALFDLSEEAKALEATESDLAKLSQMIDESADLRTVLASPLYSRDVQAGAISALADAAGLSDLVRRFLGVLATNRRLKALSAIIRDFNKLLAAHRGELSASVISAKPLTKTQLAAVAKKLKLAIGRDVAVDAQVDESLLGGLVVKVGSKMIDSSLKTKLDNLQVAMKGVR